MARSRYPGIYSYLTPVGGQKLWGCRYDEPGKDGKRVQRNRRGFATQAEAIAYQRSRSDRHARGGGTVVSSGMPLDDYLESWLAGMVDISPNTRRNYVNRLRPLQQHVGHIPLNRLTPADLDGAYGTMRRQKQSASAVRYAHRILKQALRRAVVLDMIAANPCDRVTPPKAERHEPDTWTQAEMQAFLSAEIEHPVWGDFWAVLCETWLRVGEITDLRWADIDSKQNQIRISHAVRRNDALENESGPVKTDNGRRTIPVSRSLIERLLLRRMRLGNPKASALVFPAARTGSWIEAHVARKALVAACERAGVPVIGLHEVRHSGGSIAYLAGIDLKTISARLGHSDVAFTARTYVHLNDAHQKSAADVIWGLISPARVKLWQHSDGDDPESGVVTGENRTA